MRTDARSTRSCDGSDERSAALRRRSRRHEDPGGRHRPGRKDRRRGETQHAARGRGGGRRGRHRDHRRRGGDERGRPCPRARRRRDRRSWEHRRRGGLGAACAKRRGVPRAVSTRPGGRRAARREGRARERRQRRLGGGAAVRGRAGRPLVSRRLLGHRGRRGPRARWPRGARSRLRRRDRPHVREAGRATLQLRPPWLRRGVRRPGLARGAGEAGSSEAQDEPVRAPAEARPRLADERRLATGSRGEGQPCDRAARGGRGRIGRRDRLGGHAAGRRAGRDRRRPWRPPRRALGPAHREGGKAPHVLPAAARLPAGCTRGSRRGDRRKPSAEVKAVLVTGSARGLGAAVAERLRADGFAVVGADLAGGEVRLDVRDPAGWRDAAAALAAAGEPWGLVNCAARTVVRELFSIAPDEWDDVLAVNLRGPFLGIRELGPVLRERGAGRIVNVSSDSAFKGRGVIGAHYAVSKAALIALTRRAAGALAPHGVTVNAVVPGTIDGQTVRELAGEQLDELAAEAALGRLADPAEIAALVAWLVGDESSYVTGAALVADGGASL